MPIKAGGDQRRAASTLDLWLRATTLAMVVILASWTALANVIVLSGGTFAQLRTLSPLALVAAAAALLNLLPQRREQRPPANADSSAPEEEGEPSRWPYLLIGAVLAAGFAFGNRYRVFWALTVLYLSAIFLWQLHAPRLRNRQPDPGIGNLLAFLGATGLALLAAALVNRVNADQTLPINLSVAVLDDPHLPIFRHDSVHGIAGVYPIPTYWIHSFELLAALLTQALSIGEPILLLHYIGSPALTVVSVLAAARFFRVLLPRYWGWTTLASVLLLLGLRSSYTMYGNFGFVRMFEGKSLFVTALIPLLLTYAVEFSLQPHVKNWLLLFLAQVAAVGLTANALYAAPIAAGLALGACWRPSWSASRRLAVGILASAYPIIVALVVRHSFVRQGLISGLGSFQPLMSMEEATPLVLGEGIVLWLWLLALTSGWTTVREAGARRWMLAFSLGFLATCMNPFLTQLWGAHVTGTYLTWRLFWALPLPGLLAVMLVGGLASGDHGAIGSHGIRAMTFGALAATLAIGMPWQDPVFIGLRPGLKVPARDYAVAERLNQLAGEEGPVLAPEPVSAWVPTFRRHAHPLVARRHYTQGIISVFGHQVDVQSLQDRLTLLDYVGREPDTEQGATLLKQWFQQDRIAAVAVPQAHPDLDRIREILGQAGLKPSEYLGYILFHRDGIVDQGKDGGTPQPVEGTGG